MFLIIDDDVKEIGNINCKPSYSDSLFLIYFMEMNLLLFRKVLLYEKHDVSKDFLGHFHFFIQLIL